MGAWRLSPTPSPRLAGGATDFDVLVLVLSSTILFASLHSAARTCVRQIRVVVIELRNVLGGRVVDVGQLTQNARLPDDDKQ